MRNPAIAFSGAPTRGPFFSSREIGLARGNAVHGERETARRHERLGAVVDETGIDQPVGHDLAQILRRPRLHAGGNFLGEKFEQKVGHGGQPALLPSPCGESGGSALGWGDGVAAFVLQGKWLASREP